MSLRNFRSIRLGGFLAAACVLSACANFGPAPEVDDEATDSPDTFLRQPAEVEIHTGWLDRDDGRTTPEIPEEESVIDILDQLEVAAVPQGIPSYDRDDWRHWVDDDGDCQNTRAEVLVAESYASVSFSASNACLVDAGEWYDPYTGTTVYDAQELDVDHMVPLKNAHLSGAWAWSYDERRRFANDIDHPESLIAVSSSANQSKGARGPEEWKPRDESYWCEYAESWVTIKVRWNLTVTPAEYDALADMLDTC